MISIISSIKRDSYLAIWKELKYMKKYSLVLSTLLITFVVAFGVYQVSAYSNLQEQTLEGTISSVDATGGELKVKDTGGAEKALKVGPTTKISKGGQEIKLADIKVGDKIKATVDGTAVKAIVVGG
jgi:Cu/Ag efflux protein CusF